MAKRLVLFKVDANEEAGLTAEQAQALAKKRFEMLRQGFLFGGAQGERRNGFNDVRTEAALVRKLEAVSTVKTVGEKEQLLPSGDVDRELKPGQQYMLLTGPELELLKLYVERTHWQVRVAPDAVDAIDFLTGSIEVGDEWKPKAEQGDPAPEGTGDKGGPAANAGQQ